MPFLACPVLVKTACADIGIVHHEGKSFGDGVANHFDVVVQYAQVIAARGSPGGIKCVDCPQKFALLYQPDFWPPSAKTTSQSTPGMKFGGNDLRHDSIMDFR